MRLSRVLGYLRNLATAFYRSILKLGINAHQLIAYWRNRINKKQGGVVVVVHHHHHQSSTPSSASADVKLVNLHLTESQQQNQLESIRENTSTSQPFGLSIKTPNSRRSRFHSILRRLSLRNFMEYCVIALNEASGSSCSNRFDLSTCDRPVWLLGQQYILPQEAENLVDDVKSRLWITYRRNFPPIDDNLRYTTDRGFGCMIRCGQMVLANALIYKNLGRNWRWSSNGLEANPEIYTKILKLFQDKEECPYSIHNIVRTGQQEGKVIGEWFGPNTIAQALKRLSSAQAQNETTNSGVLISIDAALDNVVVMDEIKERFKKKVMRSSNNDNLESKTGSFDKNSTDHEETSDSNKNRSSSMNDEVVGQSNEKTGESSQWVPGILFIQLRLGLTKINPLYFAALKKTFQLKNSLGIIGGRPNHALYLIGYTDDDMIYLDPHSTQQYVDFDSASMAAPQSSTISQSQPQQRQQTIVDPQDERLSSEDVSKSLPLDNSYHCACPEKMSIDRLDPSLALCFYFHNESEFDNWCSLSNDLLIKSEQAPMFEITQSRPSVWNVSLTSMAVNSLTKDQFPNSNAPTIKPKSVVITGGDRSNADDSDQKFTVLKDSDHEDSVDAQKDVESGVIDRSASNDEEEFEMLG